MQNPIEPYKPSFINPPRGTAYIFGDLQRDILRMPEENDPNLKALLVDILQLKHAVKQMGDAFGINQLPISDTEDMDTIINSTAPLIEQLRKAGKERQKLAESNYAPALQTLKTEYKQYQDERKKQTDTYNAITTDATTLRTIIPKATDSAQEKKEKIAKVKQKIEESRKILEASEHEFTRLAKNNKALMDRGTALKAQVARDASVALSIQSLKPP